MDAIRTPVLQPWARPPDCPLRCACRGALGVSFLLPALDARAANERGKARQKSLITIWLEGGASQLETWDPHPGTKIGGPTQAIATAVRGLQIADSFPQLAAEIGSLSRDSFARFQGGGPRAGVVPLEDGLSPRSDAAPSVARGDPGQPASRRRRSCCRSTFRSATPTGRHAADFWAISSTPFASTIRAARFPT